MKNHHEVRKLLSFFHFEAQQLLAKLADIFKNLRLSRAKIELLVIKFVQSFVFIFERYSIFQHNSESSGSSMQSCKGFDLYLLYCSKRIMNE